MQIVIDIPEEEYKLICSDGRPFLPSYKWIKNGIPLEQIKAEIYEEFMTIDGGVHDESAKKCMRIIDKYRESEDNT